MAAKTDEIYGKTRPTWTGTFCYGSFHFFQEVYMSYASDGIDEMERICFMHSFMLVQHYVFDLKELVPIEEFRKSPRTWPTKLSEPLGPTCCSAASISSWRAWTQAPFVAVERGNSSHCYTRYNDRYIIGIEASDRQTVPTWL
jgi:hypothetical protein